MRILTNRAIATAATALITLTTMGLQPASAGWRHRDEAIALGIFGAVLGTVAGVIAAEHAQGQPVYVPAYPYDRDHDAYAYRWHHRGHFHDDDR
jgi:ABC-type lipoprotein release transport system permease subunit